MSNRIDKDREAKLQPMRMITAKAEILKRGYTVMYEDAARIDFIYKNNRISFYPYSGWHTGKGIIDGRGFNHLFDQLKP